MSFMSVENWKIENWVIAVCPFPPSDMSTHMVQKGVFLPDTILGKSNASWAYGYMLQGDHSDISLRVQSVKMLW
jgi:hypothetical protein